MKRGTGHSSEAGTVLVETLVAVLIVGAATGVLFETIGSKASLTRQVALRRAALLTAQSELAAALTDAMASDEGNAGDLHWALVVEPYEAGARAGPLALEQVSISVAEQAALDRPLVVLHSLRAVP